jgi:hypothetical protein
MGQSTLCVPNLQIVNSEEAQQEFEKNFFSENLHSEAA